MSKTNQVCVCCEARDNCPYYDTIRTVCAPVKCTDWEDFSTIQYTTDWQQVRIQASIAIIQGWASTPQGLTKNCMKGAVELADALIDELKGGQE